VCSRHQVVSNSVGAADAIDSHFVHAETGFALDANRKVDWNADQKDRENVLAGHAARVRYRTRSNYTRFFSPRRPTLLQTP
jgi:hypothetical protein